MKNISELLANKKVQKVEKTGKSHPDWELAVRLAQKHHLKPPMVMILIKKYGFGKVAALESWLYDLPRPPRNMYSLMIWKLKQDQSLTNK